MVKIVVALLAIGMSLLHAFPVSSEDFEAGATGWSNNATTTASGFSRFLGRFSGTGGAQSVYKTYTLSGAQTQATIQFDFYEMDSWDGESFYIYINDSLYRTDSFWVNNHYSNADTPSIAVALNSGTANVGFNSSYADEFFRYTINYNTTATTLKLGFGTTLDEALDNESWGIDNVVITQNNVPEPVSALYFFLGLALLWLKRKL